MPLLDTLLSVVAPHACLVCRREGSLLCEWCVLDAFEPIPSRCYNCKRLTIDSATCVSCKRRAPLRHVWIRTQYSGVPKQLLHSFKFDRARAAAPLLAAAMGEALPYLPASTLIVPVPTATSRVRQRGYDQAVLLAQEVARQTSHNTEHAVVRLTQSRQVGSDRTHRLKQLETAFLIPKPQHIRGRDILLIDDVITTGATLQTLARNLKQNGAKSVSALLFAQKQ